MKNFLQYVAEDILHKNGTNLSRVTIVFPNKRASLFLNEELARMANRPIWSPLISPSVNFSVNIQTKLLAIK